MTAVCAEARHLRAASISNDANSTDTSISQQLCGSHRSSAVSTRSCTAQQLSTLHIPHVRQMFNWDCGLACVQMVLRGFGYHHCDYPMLRQLCPETSIWTIDLAHLLRRFNLEVTFFTITIGLNPAFQEEKFYVQHLREDERRVHRLFCDAAAAGIALQERSLSCTGLQELVLKGRYLVIALVDKRRLSPWLAAAEFCLPVLCGMDIGYTGHYVVISGFDTEEQEFIIHDPSSSSPSLRVAAAILEQARRSFGTDEDLLLVSCPLGYHQQQHQHQQQQQHQHQQQQQQQYQHQHHQQQQQQQHQQPSG